MFNEFGKSRIITKNENNEYVDVQGNLILISPINSSNEFNEILKVDYPNAVKGTLKVNIKDDGYILEASFNEKGVDICTKISVMNINGKLYSMTENESQEILGQAKSTNKRLRWSPR